MLKIVQMIDKEEINVKNAIDLITAIAKQVALIKGLPQTDQKVMVINIIRDIAKGADGIENTDDDLIPATVVAGAKALIDNSLVGSIYDMIHLEKNENIISTLGRCMCMYRK